ARQLRELEVAGSNPVSPTQSEKSLAFKARDFSFLFPSPIFSQKTAQIRRISVSLLHVHPSDIVHVPSSVASHGSRTPGLVRKPHGQTTNRDRR
ncbi:hypothetical protein, partial [uncultured Alistipes sp.]|uniref:hypothetical protein n=1 Tax=uncultured Alistipes sp. TaxID=538949 RepID=UPI00260CE3A5